MILRVGGVMQTPAANNSNYNFQQKEYAPATKEQFKRAVEKDFDIVFAAECKKLKIDILI